MKAFWRIFVIVWTIYFTTLRQSALTQSPQPTAPSSQAYIEAFSNPSRPVRSAAAAQVLAEGNTSENIQNLINGLKSEDFNTIYISATALGLLGAKEAVPELLTRIDLKKKQTTNAFIYALGEIEDHDSAVPLAKMLGQTDDPDLGNGLLRVLSKIRNPETLSMIKNRLGDSNPKIWIWAACALNRMGDESGYDKVRAVMASEKYAEGWNDAAEVFKWVGHKEDVVLVDHWLSLNPPSVDFKNSLLIAKLRLENKDMPADQYADKVFEFGSAGKIYKIWASQELRSIGTPYAREKLMKWLESPYDPQRPFVISSLRHLDDDMSMAKTSDPLKTVATIPTPSSEILSQEEWIGGIAYCVILMAGLVMMLTMRMGYWVYPLSLAVAIAMFFTILIQEFILPSAAVVSLLLGIYIRFIMKNEQRGQTRK